MILLTLHNISTQWLSPCCRWDLRWKLSVSSGRRPESPAGSKPSQVWPHPATFPTCRPDFQWVWEAVGGGWVGQMWPDVVFAEKLAGIAVSVAPPRRMVPLSSDLVQRENRKGREWGSSTAWQLALFHFWQQTAAAASPQSGVEEIINFDSYTRNIHSASACVCVCVFILWRIKVDAKV